MQHLLSFPHLFFSFRSHVSILVILSGDLVSTRQFPSKKKNGVAVDQKPRCKSRFIRLKNVSHYATYLFFQQNFDCFFSKILTEVQYCLGVSRLSTTSLRRPNLRVLLVQIGLWSSLSPYQCYMEVRTRNILEILLFL